MSSDPLSFFTIDRGTASISAALIAPFGGRFRLLAASSVPVQVDTEAVLRDLVERVVSVEPDLLPGADDWPAWARLEVATHRPRTVVCAAGNERRSQELTRAFRGAGWQIQAVASGGRGDPVALTTACLARDVDAVALSAGEPPPSDERPGLAALSAVIGAAAHRRDDLSVVLCGGAAGWKEAFPADRIIRAPASRKVEGRSGTPLHDLAVDLARRSVLWDAPTPDGRAAFRDGVASLAALLGRTIDAVDVGRSGGARIRATGSGRVAWMATAEGALLPPATTVDDSYVDAILRWSSVRAEHFGLRDRIRDLAVAPWRDSTPAGSRVRLAALRAALARISGRWEESRSGGDATNGPAAPNDLLLASGGALAAVPPAVVTLALLDSFRRPGALSILWDHARVLAPIGTLHSETDRRHLLADLLDDAFVPLGSAIVVADVRPSRQPPTLRLASQMGTTEISLSHGALRAIDLPPGLVARAEIEGRDPLWLGPRARHVVMDLSGGLGGLLVDTRDVPLRLPDRSERRRAVIEAWERPFWPPALVAS